MRKGALAGKRVLIVDDDHTLCSLLQAMIMGEGAIARTVMESTEVLRVMYAFQPDLILLDILMPHLDGLTLCHQIRGLTDVPIIMITGLKKTQNIVNGLESGADDYVTKPFQREELVARAKAVLRRAEQADTVKQPTVYHDEYLTVDLDEHMVMIEGRPVHLTVKEYGVVSYLVQHAGRVRTFAQILRQVWGVGYDGSPEYIHVYVSRIRKKLEPDPDSPIYLISVHGIGYRFEPALVSHS